MLFIISPQLSGNAYFTLIVYLPRYQWSGHTDLGRVWEKNPSQSLGNPFSIVNLQL